jgi:hypothetical protein
LMFAGLQGGPRLGDAEAGAAAALGGSQFAAWTGGLLSVIAAAVTCWAIPEFWRYRTGTGTAHGTGEGPAGAAGAAPAREPADRATGPGEAGPEPGPAS